MSMSSSNVVAGIIAATGAILFSQPAMADTDGAIFRGEGFAGIARDERPLNGREGEFSGGILPTLTFGLNGPVLVQFDGMVAEHLKDTVLAGAGHIGVKANQRVSIGVYGAFAHFDNVPKLKTYRLGGEVAYHGSRLSLSGIAGYEHSGRGSTDAGTIGSFTVIDTYGRGGSFFSMADVSFYPSENWSLTAGHRYVGRRHAAVVGTEKAFSGSGLSLFAEGRVGDSAYAAAWAGIRLKLGRNRSSSLQSSDQSGYINRLKDELFVPTNSRSRTLIAPPAPPAPPPDNGGGACCGSCYAT